MIVEERGIGFRTGVRLPSGPYKNRVSDTRFFHRLYTYVCGFEVTLQLSLLFLPGHIFALVIELFAAA